MPALKSSLSMAIFASYQTLLNKILKTKIRK